MIDSQVQAQDPALFSIVNDQVYRAVNQTPFTDASWSNLSKIVYRRTYSRGDLSHSESFKETVARVIRGNLQNIDPKFLLPNEAERLAYLMLNRKAMPAGRGLWYSGTTSHERLGGAALCNCWFTTADDWNNFVMAMDLLMLGGGVGMSIEHRFVSRLSKIKKNVTIVHKATKDADFIIPDSREGWCELVRRVFESYFVTGRSFSYSTVCVRGFGEPIAGFGGVASGPIPLIKCVEKLVDLLKAREGRHIRPIDALDILCSIGEMVVAGNVRRSAIIILGDAWDKEYLKAKRWDLGPIPTQRAMANLSVVCDDVDDLHPLFWQTYMNGEPFGIVNRKAIQTYGRMGERKKDTAIGTNPCAEAALEDGEPCNLQELFLPNITDEAEFIEAARLMHRYGKRVTLETYHNPKNDEVVKRNRRIGTGITGCLQSPLFEPGVLDRVYAAIQEENASYSRQLGINESIRTTVIKPSGTLSLMGDCTPGIHPAYSRYFIRRVRFASNDKLIPILREAGHPIEPVQRFDGSLDHGTLVADFYCRTPDGVPCADGSFDTWRQLDTVLMAQRHWADQSVSVTVYYRKDEVQKIRAWLAENLSNLKTISFLCHNDHGFKQAPLESISKDQYEASVEKIKNISLDSIENGSLESLECAGGVCPIK
jgi:ribonucleoside-triphosphate reductase